MSYFLDSNDQARFGLAEPDAEDHSEEEAEQAEPSDSCPHCYAEGQGDHAPDCPHFVEQPLPF